MARWWQRFREPLVASIVSRLALGLIAFAGLVLLPVVNPIPDRWRAFPETPIVDGWLRFDAGWYLDIAQHSYSVTGNQLGQTNVAFFPLLPLMVRVVEPFVGNVYLAALAVTNLAAIAAVMVLYQLIRERFDRATARWSVGLLLIFPYSFYLYGVYAEPLLLLVVAAAFLFGERRQWALAAAMAALASATKPIGVAVLIPLAVLYLEQRSFNFRRVQIDSLWLLLGTSGLLLHLGYLWVEFGNPLQFVASQQAIGWAGSWTFDRALEVSVKAVTAPNQLVGDELADGLNVVTALGAIGLTIAGWRRLPWSYWLWSAIVVASSLVGWRSFGRLALVAFPLFILIAGLIRPRPAVALVYGVVSTLLLALFTVVFSHWYWVAG